MADDKSRPFEYKPPRRPPQTQRLEYTPPPREDHRSPLSYTPSAERDRLRPADIRPPPVVDRERPLKYAAPEKEETRKPNVPRVVVPEDKSRPLSYTPPVSASPASWPSDQIAQIMSMAVNYTFHVTVGIDALGAFTAVENLTESAEVLKLREGGRNHSEHALFGARKRGSVTLKWGIGFRSALHNWMESVDVGRHFRREVWIFHLTRAYMPMRIYRLTGAFPEMWKGGNLSAGESLVESEELTINFDDLTLLVLPVPDVSGLTR